MKPELLTDLREHVWLNGTFWSPNNMTVALIDAWIERWHLTAPCARSWAFNELFHWSGVGRRAEPADLADYERWLAERQLAEFRDQIAAIARPDLSNELDTLFNPYLATVGEATSATIRRIEKLVQEYYGKIAEIIRDAGASRVIVKTSGYRHVTWLVRHQAMGESMTSIAQSESEVGIDPRTVSEAIHNLAAVCGLELRDPDMGGRPPRK